MLTVMVVNLTKAKEMVSGLPAIIYLPFPPALIRFKEPTRLNYLASTLTLIFLAHSCRGHCLKVNFDSVRAERCSTTDR